MGDFFGYLAIILISTGTTCFFGYLTHKSTFGSTTEWLESLGVIITTFLGSFTLLAITVAFTGDFFYKESINATALKNFKIILANDVVIVSSERLIKTFDTIKWYRATPEDITLIIGYNILGLNDTKKYILKGDK